MGNPVRLRHGQREVWLHVPAKGHIASIIVKSGGFYEPRLLAAIAELKLGGTYVDVGAHIGNHTVFFCDCCPCTRVIAIEPVAANLEYLRKNAEGREKIEVVAAAATNKDDGRKLRKLDVILADVEEVALIKIDIGRGADKVLAGGASILKKHRPVVVVEAANAKLYDAVQLRLSRYGYAVTGKYNETATYVFEPVSVVVNVITYNRPLYLERLLQDLSTQPSYVTVRIYEDASTVDMGRSVKLARKQHWFWHRFNHNHGKRGFWQVVTKVMQDAAAAPPNTMFVWLPDDVRLCGDFVTEALVLWNTVCLPTRVAVNLQAEKLRDELQCWTGFSPKRIHRRLWHTQWVDGVMICNHQALQAVDYRIPKPSDSRWKKPNISSGVWQHFSQKLHGMGLGMYRSYESLVAHMSGPSVMHGAHRSKEPLKTTRFKGGAGKHTRFVAKCPLQASLASIPSRVDNLKRVVASLLPQVDVLRVYLNGYDEIPWFLKHKRIVVATSQEHGDLGDAGKMFWCEQAKGYQFTCDDDLVYPQNYTELLVDGIERFKRRAVVGLHGICIDRPPRTSYYTERRLLHWRDRLVKDTSVHLLGTGALGYHAGALKLIRGDFESPNMADVWLGLVCQRERVPMVAIAHPGKWLSHLPSPWTIYQKQKGKDERQTEAVRRVGRWVCWLKKGRA